MATNNSTVRRSSDYAASMDHPRGTEANKNEFVFIRDLNFPL